MNESPSSIALAKEAWSWLDGTLDWTKGENAARQERYFDLLADDVVLDVDSSEDDPTYGSEIRGKAAVIQMYKSAPEWIEANHLEGPLQFFESGNRVFVVGAERYTLKKNGVVAKNKKFVIMLDIEDGFIKRIQQVGDMSEWIEASRLDNLALAREAYSALEAGRGGERKQSDFEPYLNLLADDVKFRYAAPADSLLGRSLDGKPAVVEFLTDTAPTIVEDVRLDRPLEFVGGGDRVIVLGSESYTLKATGIRATKKEFAVVLTFRGNKIVEIVQIKDLTELRGVG